MPASDHKSDTNSHAHHELEYKTYHTIWHKLSCHTPVEKCSYVIGRQSKDLVGRDRPTLTQLFKAASFRVESRYVALCRGQSRLFAAIRAKKIKQETAM
jgi:hypothetical protein